MNDFQIDPDWRAIAVFATRASEAEVRRIISGADPPCEFRLRAQDMRVGDDRTWYWFDTARRASTAGTAVEAWFGRIRPALAEAFPVGDPRRVYLSVQ